MRSGIGLPDSPRRPGVWTAWGQSVTVVAGAVLPERQLVRASLGRPMPWAVAVYLIGASVGDVVVVNVEPGLGSAVALQVTSLSSVTPVFIFPGVGCPAVELVVSVRSIVLSPAGYRVVAQAAPVGWTPSEVDG